MKLQLRLTTIAHLLSRHFRWVLSGVVVLLLLVGVFTILAPKWQEVSNLGLLTLERERQLTKEQEAYLAELKQSLAKFRTYSRSDIELLERILPSRFDVAPIFIETSELFANSGYTLDSITILDRGETSESARASRTGGESAVVRELIAEAQEKAERVFLNENLRVIDLNLKLTGSSEYGSLKKLLTTIERSQRLMDIQAVGFTIDDGVVREDGEETGGSIDLAVKIYYFDFK